MGNVIKLNRPIKGELEEQAYEFKTSISSLRAFGHSEVCIDLKSLIDDWVKGTSTDLEVIDLNTKLAEAAKFQGIILGLRYFRQFLSSLKELEIEEEGEDNDN